MELRPAPPRSSGSSPASPSSRAAARSKPPRRSADADLDTLQSLVEKSLLRFTNERYWMLETIREYASQQLSQSAEVQDLRKRHLTYFAALVEKADAERLGDLRHMWIDRLELERENVRRALSRAQQADNDEGALQLVMAHSWFWYARGPLAEGLCWLEPALAAAVDAPPEQRAAALRRLAGFSIRLGDAARAHRAADESLALYRRIGNDVEIAMALEEVGESLSQLGDVPRARECFAEALELLREHGTDVEFGRVVISMGYLELSQHTYDRAAELFDEGLARMRQSSSPREVAYASLNSGTVRLALGDLEAAEPHLRESFALYRSVMDPAGYAYSIEALGILKERLGAHDDAVALLGAADRRFQENGIVIQAFELLFMTRRCTNYRRPLARLRSLMPGLAVAIYRTTPSPHSSRMQLLGYDLYATPAVAAPLGCQVGQSEHSRSSASAPVSKSDPRRAFRPLAQRPLTRQPQPTIRDPAKPSDGLEPSTPSLPCAPRVSRLVALHREVPAKRDISRRTLCR